MGPLSGVKVLEIAGIGPGPFAAMMLADMGADVIRVDRAEAAAGFSPEAGRFDVLARSRRSVALNLKQPQAVEVLLRLVESSDILLEGFRPGVAERLGVGPDDCLARNPRLVYGRMTGWGQTGPYAERAGHDVNYISIAGALHPMGSHDGPPAIPLNLVGDFGGGGMFLAFGLVCALLEARGSGQGQVVDAAIVDGTVSLMAMTHGMLAQGLWRDERGSNLLDSGAPYYDVYRCADGGYLSVGALEPKFYEELLRRLGLSDDPTLRADRFDRANWPAQRARLAEVIETRSRDEWMAVFADSDACVAPVLSIKESMQNEHLRTRGTYVDVDGVTQPAPAPRFSRTAPVAPTPPPLPGEHSVAVLQEYGYSAEDIEKLSALGAVRTSRS